MANSPLTQILGTTRARQITAQSGGKPILNTFVSSDVLTAFVWSGESQTVLLSPTVAWITPAAATILLTITAAQLGSAGITPGTYRIEVVVTPISDNQPRAVYYGLIRFEATAGSEAALQSWASYQDVLNFSSQIGTLQDPDSDLAQFSRQRNYAMLEHIAFILRRYSPTPGQSRRFVSADGLAAGPYLRFSPSPTGAPEPTREAVKAWLLGPGRVILNEDIIEANALLAASQVFAGQPGSNNPYAELAARERTRAMQAMDRAFVEIDTTTSPDGIADIRVDRNVVYLT